MFQLKHLYAYVAFEAREGLAALAKAGLVEGSASTIEANHTASKTLWFAQKITTCYNGVQAFSLNMLKYLRRDSVRCFPDDESSALNSKPENAAYTPYFLQPFLSCSTTGHPKHGGLCTTIVAFEQVQLVQL